MLLTKTTRFMQFAEEGWESIDVHVFTDTDARKVDRIVVMGDTGEIALRSDDGVVFSSEGATTEPTTIDLSVLVYRRVYDGEDGSSTFTW